MRPVYASLHFYVQVHQLQQPSQDLGQQHARDQSASAIVFLMYPLLQLTHPRPSQVISSAPQGTCQNGAAQEEGMAGTQVPFSKERKQVQGPLEGSFMRGTGQANIADP